VLGGIPKSSILFAYVRIGLHNLEKNMRAFEFQATAHQHLLRLPDTIPDGVPLRVLLLLDEDVLPANQQVRRKPSPKLAGTVTMQDDLTAPAIPADDWDALQ
jgi:hypothetical protein